MMGVTKLEVLIRLHFYGKKQRNFPILTSCHEQETVGFENIETMLKQKTAKNTLQTKNDLSSQTCNELIIKGRWRSV